MESTFEREQTPGKRFAILSAVLGGIFGLFFLLMLVFNFADAGALTPLLLFFTALSLAGLFCLLSIHPHCPSWVLAAAGAGGLLLLLLAQLRFAKAIYGNIAYDFNYVYVASRALARGGGLGGCQEYFARYPNNVLLVLVFSLVIRLCDILGIANLMAALTGCSLLAVDAAVLFSCLCAKKLWGKRAAFLTLVLSVPLVILHYGVVCPYSDTFSMMFPPLLLFLYLHRPERGKKAWLATALMGAAAALGFKIKPQVAIIAIALFLTELFYAKWTKARLLLLGKRLACFCAAAVLTLAAYNGVTRAAVGSVLTEELKEQNEASFTHYLMMGLNPETDGFISGSDWSATFAIPGKKAKMEFNLRVAGERLAQMGPGGYLSFLGRKARGIFNGVRMDMWVRSPFPNEDALSKVIQNSFCQGGSGFSAYQCFLHALWVMLLLLWVLPTMFCPWSYRDKSVTVLRLTVTGLAMFLLLFEAGPRYLFHQYPIFILLAVWGAQNLPAGLRSAWGAGKRLFTRWAKKETASNKLTEE